MIDQKVQSYQLSLYIIIIIIIIIIIFFTDKLTSATHYNTKYRSNNVQREQMKNMSR